MAETMSPWLSRASLCKTSDRLTSRAVQRHLLVTHQSQVPNLPTGSHPKGLLAAGTPSWWEPLVSPAQMSIPQARYVSKRFAASVHGTRGKICQPEGVQILSFTLFVWPLKSYQLPLRQDPLRDQCGSPCSTIGILAGVDLRACQAILVASP